MHLYTPLRVPHACICSFTALPLGLGVLSHDLALPPIRSVSASACHTRTNWRKGTKKECIGWKDPKPEAKHFKRIPKCTHTHIIMSTIFFFLRSLRPFRFFSHFRCHLFWISYILYSSYDYIVSACGNGISSKFVAGSAAYNISIYIIYLVDLDERMPMCVCVCFIFFLVCEQYWDTIVYWPCLGQHGISEEIQYVINIIWRKYMFIILVVRLLTAR